MNNLLQLTDRIKEELEANVIINAVGFGDMFDLEVEKQTIFPMAHVGMTTARIGQGVAFVDMSILFLDIVDTVKTEQSDNFYGNDNEHYVINNMFSAATKTVQELMRGDLYNDGFQVEEESVEITFFSERFKDKLAGCGVNFTVTIKNTLDLC
jgi:hypothetical protein